MYQKKRSKFSFTSQAFFCYRQATMHKNNMNSPRPEKLGFVCQVNSVLLFCFYFIGNLVL